MVVGKRFHGGMHARGRGASSPAGAVVLAVAMLALGVFIGAVWQGSGGDAAANRPSPPALEGRAGGDVQTGATRRADAQDAASSGLVPIEDLVARVVERYDAQLIDASLTSGRRHENTSAVQELRFMTRQGHVLRVRFDAVTGDWLEVDGRGQIEARRMPDAQ